MVQNNRGLLFGFRSFAVPFSIKKALCLSYKEACVENSQEEVPVWHRFTMQSKRVLDHLSNSEVMEVEAQEV